MHALLLDDEPKVLASVRQALSGRGIKLTCFSKADALLAIAPSSDAEVILLDYDLGATDGLTVFQALRAKGVTTPCILYTGKAKEDDRIQARRAGFVEGIRKGTSPKEIAAILFSVLRRCSDPPAERSAPHSLTLDANSGKLRSPTSDHRIQLENQQLKLFTLLVTSGPLRRKDLAPKLFKEPYPEDDDAGKRMDDRITHAIRRLCKALGDLECLVDCHGGVVMLTARVALTASGTFPATRPAVKQAAAPTKRHKRAS